MERDIYFIQNIGDKTIFNFMASRWNLYGYAEEFLTCTLQGPWHSTNDYSVSILLNDYLNVTGDNKFLSEKI